LRKNHDIGSWKVRFRETSKSDPLKRCRKVKDDIKTGGFGNSRISTGGT